ncbi:MAG: phosphoribosylanthranilate isomerase [Muricoprocola sp.]
MTRIKLCGLSRTCDIEAVNELQPEYAGFILARAYRRYVPPNQVAELKKMLDPRIQAVGVFVNEKPETVAEFLNQGIIDMAQLHGEEGEEYIHTLRNLTSKPLIKAFKVTDAEVLDQARKSSADYILLDAGCGTGTSFDWSLIEKVGREYFLAGGLNPENAPEAIKRCRPYALDVSSGIETDGVKDKEKMAAFVKAVRNDQG